MAGKHSKSFFDFRKSSALLSEQKKSTTLSLPFKIAIGILVASLVLSSVLVGNFFFQSTKHKKIFANARKMFGSMSSGDAIAALAQENADIKGWLKIPNTNIDYVVCQSTDNEFYLNHNQLGKKSRYGALFLAKNDSFKRADGDHNIVIFGNNMKDGTMFGSLQKYRNLRFYKQNPCFELYYGNKEESYIIFAMMLLSSSADDSGDTFVPSKSFFSNKNEFDIWSKEALSRSLINTSVDVTYDDEILTLVTVADDFEGARFVVMAKKIDQWDAQHSNVTTAKVNPKIKYPKIWYEKRGLEYPY